MSKELVFFCGGGGEVVRNGKVEMCETWKIDVSQVQQ